jgi:hypothetical protein
MPENGFDAARVILDTTALIHSPFLLSTSHRLRGRNNLIENDAT